jgi:hypothetical protein
MPAKKIILDPDDVLEWLLDRGYVEPTSSANAPYRIATSEDDFLPYSITFLTKKLSEHFCKRNMKIRSTNRKVWRRELYKCFEEHGIRYDDKGTRGSMYWEFQETTKKRLEQKLHIDLDQIAEYDSTHRKKGGTRYTSYYHQQLKRYGETRALELFRRYYERRMEELSVDLRTKRLSKKDYDK